MQMQNPNTKKIVGMIANRLGTDPKALEAQLAAGKFDAVFKKLSPADSAKMQTLINNPKLAQQLINTPQAKEVLKKFMDQAE